jgi:nitrate/nitrite transporter NarK
MGPKKKILVVNVLYWVVAMLLHPLSNLLTKNSGETPKIYSLLIPWIFIGLAFGSTYMMWMAIKSQCTGEKKEPTSAPDPSRR